jgi:hypothetical protein
MGFDELALSAAMAFLLPVRPKIRQGWPPVAFFFGAPPAGVGDDFAPPDAEGLGLNTSPTSLD